MRILSQLKETSWFLKMLQNYEKKPYFCVCCHAFKKQCILTWTSIQWLLVFIKELKLRLLPFDPTIVGRKPYKSVQNICPSKRRYDKNSRFSASFKKKLSKVDRSLRFSIAMAQALLVCLLKYLNWFRLAESRLTDTIIGETLWTTRLLKE